MQIVMKTASIRGGLNSPANLYSSMYSISTSHHENNSSLQAHQYRHQIKIYRVIVLIIGATPYLLTVFITGYW